MDKRDSIITVITSPLGFFALALLIVEGFIGIIITGSGNTMSPGAKETGMYLSFIAFLVLVGIVAFMVWLIPEQLLLRGEDWMEKARRQNNWADSENPTTKPEVDKMETGTSE